MIYLFYKDSWKFGSLDGKNYVIVSHDELNQGN